MNEVFMVLMMFSLLSLQLGLYIIASELRTIRQETIIIRMNSDDIWRITHNQAAKANKDS